VTNYENRKQLTRCPEGDRSDASKDTTSGGGLYIMRSDNKPVHRPGVTRSPVFWRALIAVFACNIIFMKLFLWPIGAPDAERAIVIPLGQIGFAITQVVALVLGIYQLRVRKNRPFGLGLLVPVLLIVIVPIVLGIVIFLLFRLSGAQL